MSGILVSNDEPKKGFKCSKCFNIYSRDKTVDVYITPQFYIFLCIYCLDKNNTSKKEGGV